ncbi:MAG TPA: serine/threonine-protein kinase [Ktedonobacteraceae bacterium]|nr:serine/threonine-protein kinase [Ktedonobacteraceae bacterium]
MSQIPQRIGKYELQEILGRGGMAEVWKAFDTQLHRYIAIKLLHANLQADPDFISRFTHEAQMVAALRHPNIVQIYDFHTSELAATEETTAYMVMEYIKGKTLDHYIRTTSRQKNFPLARDIIRLFTPISLALDYAHQQGTIHRDIKPANILLDQNNRTRNPMGEPILSDFGLAKVMDAPSQTVAGVVFGTPLYIAPEQVQNRPISNRTDLYSLGIVLYELFTSRPPFHGDSSSAIMLQRVTDEPTDPRSINPDLSSALSEVLIKSIAKDPQDRFPTAAAMIAALAQALDLPIPEDVRLALASINKAQVSTNDALPIDQEAATIAAAIPTDTPAHQQIDRAVDNDADGSDVLTAERTQAASDPTYLPDSEPPLRGTAISEKTMSAEILSSRQTTPPQARRQLSSGDEQRSESGAQSDAREGHIPSYRSGTRKRGRMRLVIAALLIGILIVAGSGAFFLRQTPHKTIATTGTTTTIGQAFFVSNISTNQDTVQGANSKLEINLKSVPAPQHGKSYYAWLLPDKNNPEGTPILLGQLTVKNGNVHYIYAGDTNASDLLITTSRFLITEESSTVTPDIPSPDLNAWRYYAEIPQTVPAGQQYSLLDHLRHLLAKDPELMALHISGGLDVRTNQNIRAMAQWSQAAQSDWKAKKFDAMRQHVASILDYLDGATYVKQDVPAGIPLYVNHLDAQVGLLKIDSGSQAPTSYLYHIALHLNGVISSPGSTQYQRSLAVQINTGLNNVKVELGQTRQDAIRLVHMNDTQLAQSSSLALLKDMVAQTNVAYLGSVDAATHQVKKMGMAQIYQDSQRLATFEIKPYHHSS